jgi:hypothetical protein
MITGENMPKDTQQETQIVVTDLNIQLPMAKPEYKSMLANIADKAPAIAQASSNFYKSHSQMMSCHTRRNCNYAGSLCEAQPC